MSLAVHRQIFPDQVLVYQELKKLLGQPDFEIAQAEI